MRFMMGFMIALDSEASKEKSFVIDLEIGKNAFISEKEGQSSDISSIAMATSHLTHLWNGFGMLSNDEEVMSLQKDFPTPDVRPFENGESSGERSFLGDEKLSLLRNKTGNERQKEKGLRKPSKPPRPPKTLSLDAADQKMVREMSELVMLKRSRIEMMKSLRNMKIAKAGSNRSNLCALFVTILFCVIITWHGLSSNGNSVVKAHGSPEPSLLHYGGLYD